MKNIFLAIVIVIMVCLFSVPVFATTYTWTGGGGADTNMDTNANWGVASHPSVPADTVIFATAVNHVATASTVNAEQNAHITFNSANDFTVAGTSNFGIGNVTPGTDGITAQTPDANNRIYTISAPVLLYDSQVWTVSNNGANTTTLAVSGAIGQNGSAYGLTKAGDGMLTLNGTNTYTGATIVNGGTLQAGKVTAAFGNGSAVTVGAAGTLNLGGFNETIGSLTGAAGGIVTNTGANATLTVGDATPTTTFSGVIQNGTGITSLTKQGAGTLVLNGNNTFTGGVNITAGTIKLGSATGMGLTGNSTFMSSGATLDLNGQNVTTAGGEVLGLLGNGVGGGGALRNSSGSASWTGYNIYLNGGDARINADASATLTIGGASLLQLGSHDLTVGGDGNTTINRVITSNDANGALTKDGAGTLTLSSVNTFTGATTINTGGTLALDATGTIAQSSGVANAGTFTIAASKTIQSLNGAGSTTIGTLAAHILTIGDTTNNRSSTYTGIASGPGGITTAGTGTLTLSGANTYTGATTIGVGSTLQAGSAGALGASAVTNSSANGTLDIGTTSLSLGAGYYTQGAATATLKLTANSSAAFGNIASTTGVDHITNGVVNVNVGGYIPNGATLAIITGAAGSTYTPASITSTNPYINFSGSTSGGVYTLTAVRSGSSSFSGTASNSNAAAVGGVLDNVTSPSSDMTAVLTTLGNLSSTQVNSALNSMQPDTDGSNIQVTQATLDQLTDTILGHQAATRGIATGDTGVSTGSDALKGVDVWVEGFGSYLHQDPRQLSNGYNANIWGTALGFDLPAFKDIIRIGTCFGFAQDYVRGKDSSNRNDINAYQWTIYGEYAKDKLYVDLSGAFALNTYDATRQVSVGAISRTPEGDYNGEQYQVYVEAGYTFNFKDLGFDKVTVSKIHTEIPYFSLTELNITPLASFQYQHLHLEKYTESGADSMDLAVNAQDYDLAQTGFGVKLDYPLTTKYGQLVPEVRVKWLYDWVGDSEQASSSFSGGGGSFATNGFTPAQSTWDFGTKLTMYTKNNWTVAANYDFQVKEDFYGHYGYVDAKYSF